LIGAHGKYAGIPCLYGFLGWIALGCFSPTEGVAASVREEGVGGKMFLAIVFVLGTWAIFSQAER
jgi:hypothetical protein